MAAHTACWTSAVAAANRAAQGPETESLIRRVKASNPLPEGEWDDNVFRPKQFDGDKRKLH